MEKEFQSLELLSLIISHNLSWVDYTSKFVSKGSCRLGIFHCSKEEEIETILCAKRWCCLSSFLGYWAQSWMGRHSDTGYQQAGTHFADLGRMTG